jgi:hypothetical protein
VSTRDSTGGWGRNDARALLSAVRLNAQARQAELLLVGSVLAAGLFLFRRLDQGWVSHDDGSLAQSAERILGGELPHRDFAELYTGLLSFLNAAVFAVFGHDIFNLRLPLFVLFLAFAGVFFALARRLVSPIWAFVATLFAVTWSVPVYPAPLPSWYQLFLATFALYALVRFVETGRRRWLVVAGACTGISIAIKIVGVYLALAAVLGLLVRPLLGEHASEVGRRRSAAYAGTVSGAALLVLAFVFVVMRGNLGTDEFVWLLVPIAILCAATAVLGLWGHWSLSGAQARAAFGDVGVFLAAAAVPVALLAVPYLVTGSLSDLVEGTLVAPKARFEYASFELPPPAKLREALPLLALILALPRMPRPWRGIATVAAAAYVVVLAVTSRSDSSYSTLWDATRALAPFVLVLGATALVLRGRRPESRRIVAMIVLVAGLSTLIQFPFAAPVYFCYVAPLLLLAAVGAMRVFDLLGAFPAVVLVCLVLFGAFQLDRQSLLSLGYAFRPDPHTATLDGDRASIRILPDEKRALDRVRDLVGRHSERGDVIFAGPDAPEVYYLTQSRNVTPSLIDFIESSGAARGDKLVKLLRDREIRVVVLNLEPDQSPELAAATVDRIRRMYGSATRAGKFEVRWIGPRAALHDS